MMSAAWFSAVRLRLVDRRVLQLMATVNLTQRRPPSTAATTGAARYAIHEGKRRSGEWDLLASPGAWLLLAGYLWSSADTDHCAESQQWWWPFGGGKSPFDDPRLRRAQRQRKRANVKLQEYVDSMRLPTQELIEGVKKGKVSQNEFSERMRAISEDVQVNTQRIIYDVTDPPDARRRYEAEFGFCRATPEAIQIVSSLSPLVEICAGRGHWQRALSSAGATIVAYDNGGGASPHPYSGDLAPVGHVLKGEEGALRLHRDKTLLLVHPPSGNIASRCLQMYEGEYFVYVGEGRGGVNASDAFFDELDAEWEPTVILELDPFPQCFERLYVMRRKPRRAATEPVSTDRKEKSSVASEANP